MGSSMDGQMSIFDYPEFLPEKKKSDLPCDDCSNDVNGRCSYSDKEDFCVLGNKKDICKHSGHSCNKEELWKVAAESDPFCPRVCCRFCNTKMCGARCNGSEEPVAQNNSYTLFHEHCTHRGWLKPATETEPSMWMCSYAKGNLAKCWDDWAPCKEENCPLLKEANNAK